MVKIAASILAADFSRLGQQLEELTQLGGIDRIHIDVMDGAFVPNLTVGPAVIKSIRSHTPLPFYMHLMINAAYRFFPDFVDAGANGLIVHPEACPHLHRDIEDIRKLEMKAGIALNPATPLTQLEEILEYVDEVLLMTVDPGFGGQPFIRNMPAKIARLRRMIDERGLPIEIAVDGGINSLTAPLATKAGADVLVVGTALFNHKSGLARALEELRQGL